MELKEFVSKTIIEIFEGVKDAQEKSKGLNARVNPFEDIDSSNGIYTGKRNEIHFEVLLSELSNNESKGGIGVFLGNFGIGANEKTGNENTLNTKIKFSVEVVYPMYVLNQ